MGRRQREPDIEDQLRRAVARSGMSLNRLGRAVGVNQSQLSRFLRGERSLTLTAAAKLCTFLGLRLTGPALEPKE
jgi:transcriptional regulator with XRE-family HTH domain